MGKQKYLVIAAGLLIIAVPGVYGYLKFSHKTKPSDATLGASTVSSFDGNASGNTIQLNQAGTEGNSNSGGLSVSNSSPNSLGQQQGNTSQQGFSSNNSSSSSSSGAFDPSTFSKYDKYKGSQSALFAEVQAGNGTAVAANSKVSVYYKGWLTDGTLFDESRTDSSGNVQPFTFTEGAHQVIPGWEQAIYGMKQGGIRLLIIPPAVGYGAQGQGNIPPNSVLVFEVQAVSVQ